MLHVKTMCRASFFAWFEVFLSVGEEEDEDSSHAFSIACAMYAADQ